jgi:hypothetical protein
MFNFQTNKPDPEATRLYSCLFVTGLASSASTSPILSAKEYPDTPAAPDLIFQQSFSQLSIESQLTLI